MTAAVLSETVPSRPSRPSRPSSRRVPPALAAVGCLVLGGALFVGSLGYTSAAFVESVHAESALDGGIDVRQQAGADHADPADARIVSALEGTGGVVSRLAAEPEGDPALTTAGFPVHVTSAAGSAPAAVWLSLRDPGLPDGVWSALRVGVYTAAGESLLPDGAPLSPAALGEFDDGRGLPVGELPAGSDADGAGLDLVVKVWLAPAAPGAPAAAQAAEAASLPVLVELRGETADGADLTLEAVYS